MAHPYRSEQTCRSLSPLPIRRTMTKLAESLRARLREAADPARAPAMQAYMKSATPYLGVLAVPLRKLCREGFGGLRWTGSTAWQVNAPAVCAGAGHPGERYA